MSHFNHKTAVITGAASGIGKAIASGQLTADDIATETFKAMAEKRFYVIPHDYMRPVIETRMHEILAQQNPTLPK